MLQTHEKKVCFLGICIRNKMFYNRCVFDSNYPKVLSAHARHKKTLFGERVLLDMNLVIKIKIHRR